MSKIILLRKALEDIRNSRDWYDEKDEGLGKIFVENVDDCIASIAETPNAYPVKYRVLRARLVKMFPYSVFYQVENMNVIRVYAILHHRQNADRILNTR